MPQLPKYNPEYAIPKLQEIKPVNESPVKNPSENVIHISIDDKVSLEENFGDRKSL